MKLLAGIQRRIGKATMITVPMLPCAIATILLIFTSVIVLTFYLSPISAYSHTEPFHLIPQYKSVVSSSSGNEQQQIQQQSQPKAIEASGHFK